MQFRLYSSLGVLSILALCSMPLCAQSKETDNQTSKLAHVYQRAHILASRGAHTVIPLRSIIYQPAQNEAKVIKVPSGKFRFWPDFLPQNRDWLLTFEVTLDQAKGNKPIPDHKLKEFAKINRTVVATYRQNPISVRTFKKPIAENQK